VRQRIIGLAIVNILLVSMLTILAPNFLKAGNWIAILNNMALETVVLSAAAMLMIGGMLDLSIDGTIAMSGVVAGKLMTDGWNPYAAAAVGVGCGGVVGMANGLAINKGRANPLVVTLATGWMALGVAYGLTQGKSFYGFPAAFQALAQTQIFGLRIIVLYGLLAVLGFSFVLHLTRFGSWTFLSGDNPESSRLMGISVEGVHLKLYIATGMAAGFVGVMLASRLDAATPIIADGTALRVIAAAVIGGCSLAGGYGTIAGGVLGLLLMNVLSNAAILVGISVYWSKWIIGLTLLAAVLLDPIGRDLYIKVRRGKNGKG